jgi:hypothetical protein
LLLHVAKLGRGSESKLQHFSAFWWDFFKQMAALKAAKPHESHEKPDVARTEGRLKK